MQAYLEALGLWEVTEENMDPPPLPANPTLNQIKIHEEAKQKKPKALTSIHQVVTKAVFSRIINIKSPKEVWDKLKLEFEGNNKVKSVNLRTLKREFDLMKMKDGENVKDYTSRLLDVANKNFLMKILLRSSLLVYLQSMNKKFQPLKSLLISRLLEFQN